MESSAARTALEASAAGREYVQLVSTHVDLQANPKLQNTLVEAAARIVEEGKASGAGKENKPVPAPAAGANTPADMSSALLVLKDISMVSPRGKFDIAFMPSKLVITNAKAAPLTIRTSAITHVAILDNLPTDPKKTKVLLFLGLEKSEAEVVDKQKLGAAGVIIQISSSDQLKAVLSGGEDISGQAAVVLCTALGKAGVSPSAFCSPDPSLYQNAKGGAAVAAVVKVSPGWLFPLSTCLLFIEKPALFEAHAGLAGVEFKRVQSSTFDVVLHRRGGLAPLELSQIDKSELSRLQEYFRRSKIRPIEEVLAAQAAAAAAAAAAAGSSGHEAAASGAAAAAAAAAGGPSGADRSSSAAAAAAAAAGSSSHYDGDDDDDDEDFDFDPDAPESDDEARYRAAKRPRRDPSAPGPSSAAADDDEEDDEEDQDVVYSEDEDEEDLDLTDEEDLQVAAVRRVIQGQKGPSGGSGSRKGSGAGGSGSGSGKRSAAADYDDEEEYDDDDDDE